MSSIKGLTYQGKIEEFTENNKVQLEFATMTRKGSSKIALDVAPMGLYSEASDAAEAGSTDYKIIATGHSALKGDTIRFLVTANSLDVVEICVKNVSANEIVLDGVLSASLTTGDTFEILRAISPTYNSSGAALIASAGPIQFNLDTGGGPVATSVLEDTGTPSNNAPLPVKLTGVTGDINITAGDLNVQTSHVGASFDSMRIGDGTEIANVSTSNELQVRDDDANTDLDTIAGAVSGSEMQVDIVSAGPVATEATLAAQSAKLPAALGQLASAASLSTVLSTEQEVILSAIKTAVEIIDNAIAGSEMQVDLVGLGGAATEATLSTLNGKFGSVGQKASSGSAPMVLSTEQEVILTAIQTAVEIIDNAVSGSEMQVDLVGIADVATDTTLAAMSAKLPAALGQAVKAASLSVTLASDQEPVNTALAMKDFLDSGVVDTSSSNIPTGSNLTVVASLAAAVKKIQIIDDIGEFITLRDGATVLAYLPLGGGEVEVDIAAATTLGLRSESGSTINIGKIAINFLG